MFNYIEDPAEHKIIIIIIFVWLKIDLIVFRLRMNGERIRWRIAIRYSMFHILNRRYVNNLQWMQPLSQHLGFERHTNKHWYHHEMGMRLSQHTKTKNQRVKCENNIAYVISECSVGRMKYLRFLCSLPLVYIREQFGLLSGSCRDCL